MERLPPRIDFMESPTLRLDVVDVNRKMMHRTRYVIEVCTAKDRYVVTKLFGEMRTLSQQLIKKYGLTALELGTSSILTRAKIENAKEFVKNINFILNSPQYAQLKDEIRSHVYTFIVSQQDDQEDQPKVPSKDNTTSKAGDSTVGSENRVAKSTSIHSDTKLSQSDESKVRQLPVKECWVLCQGDWHHFKPLVRDSTLIFQGTRTHYYYMKGANVEMNLEPYCHISFSHKYDQHPVHIRMDPPENVKVDRDRYQPYLLFYTIVRELAKCQKVRLDIETVGKCSLQLVNMLPPKQLQKEKEGNQQFFIKLIHEEVTLHTLVFSPMHVLGIIVHLPIISPYGIIRVEIYQKVNSWIHKNPVDELISNDDLEVQELYKCINSGHLLQYVLTMSKQVKDKEVPPTLLTLRLRDESSVQSYFVTNDRDCSQGQEVQREYSKEEMRVSINRCKRITATISQWLETIEEEMHFRHPVKGYMLYGFLLLLVWVFDWNRFAEYLLMLTVLIALSSNPTVRQVAWELVIKLQLRQFYQQISVVLHAENPNYMNPQVRSISKVNRTRLLENFELKMKKKRSLYSKYKRLLEVLFFIQQLLTAIAQNVQKLKNLLNWTHRRKTAYYIGFGSLAFVVLAYFPIRVLFTVVLLYNMNKHRNFYPKVYLHNKAIVMEIVKRTYMLNQKELSDFHPNIVDTKRYIDPARSYYPVLQKKLIEMIMTLLGLDVNENLVREYTSVQAITQVLSTYGKRLRINAQYRREMELYDIHPQWFTDGNRLHQGVACLHSYLYNIPSDRYLMECPPPKLKQLEY